MGTPDFATGTLEAIHAAGHEVVAVVTQADKPVGRKAELTAPPVKRAAMARGIPVLQPARVREESFLSVLRELAPEVIVVAAFGQILPKPVLELPRYGCLNVQLSLRTKYRGAAPIQWAIYDGETETGVTIMQMNEGLDTGDMLAKRTVPIEADETGGSLFEKLSRMGAALLVETLERLPREELCPEKQPDESPTAYARMIKKEDGRVDWARSAAEIERQVRAMDPWPGAWTTLDGKMLKIWKTACAEAGPPASDASEPGAVLTGRMNAQEAVQRGGSLPGAFQVQTGSGVLQLLEIQLEGKRRMEAEEFLRGRAVDPGTVLGE